MFTDERSAVRSLKFTRAGQHLLAGHDNGRIVIFDVNSGLKIDVI
jgi:WD40 repeat protein